MPQHEIRALEAFLAEIDGHEHLVNLVRERQRLLRHDDGLGIYGLWVEDLETSRLELLREYEKHKGLPDLPALRDYSRILEARRFIFDPYVD